MNLNLKHFATSIRSPYSDSSEVQVEISSDDPDRGLLLALVRSHTLSPCVVIQSDICLETCSLLLAPIGPWCSAGGCLCTSRSCILLCGLCYRMYDEDQAVASAPQSSQAQFSAGRQRGSVRADVARLTDHGCRDLTKNDTLQQCHCSSTRGGVAGLQMPTLHQRHMWSDDPHVVVLQNSFCGCKTRSSDVLWWPGKKKQFVRCTLH